MTNFSLGSIRNWEEIELGSLYEFPVPAAGYRAVEFHVMSDQWINCYCLTPTQSWLVATGAGFLAVKFTVNEDSGVRFELRDPEATGIAYMRTFVEFGKVAPPVTPSYVTLAPRPFGASDNFQKLMLVQEMNRRRREEKLERQMESLRQDVIEARASSAREPKPKVVKAAKPAEEGSSVDAADE